MGANIVLQALAAKKPACDLQENSEEVYNNLQRAGMYRTALLHGGKSQEMREECIKGFREGEYSVMIATDVAGRGIDVKDVGLVVNYDMPHTIEHYTHRIGRTGRAGRRGTAVTFLTAADDKTFYDLKHLLEVCARDGHIYVYEADEHV